ncbi:Manganese/iron superoxide dismutase [Clostridium sp. DL-VIII]|uniref:superoxide dismutase n=1 Tax=Clostridium sp. DL-VIII TaxID=641107 RepID=UPI00023AFE3A|nr:superoxide dismutase [Clostridium sp. DL-VIII]EHJ00273.1 Manganese/iron superoxide dismutase [Clostridium sp. DL-VIII]
MYNIQAQPYDFRSVQGISMKQLNEHYKLYTGYINKLNEIWNTPYTPDDYTGSNATYSKMRCLKLGETYALDGVKLHQLYFENMIGGNNTPSGPILNSILKQFSSYDNFISYLTDVGLSMRGWAVLSVDSIDNSLHIIGSDAHDVGAVWLSCPILVMDLYEHAYFMDFGTDKGKYISTFIRNINWNVLNDRLRIHGSLTPTMTPQRINYYPFEFCNLSFI